MPMKEQVFVFLRYLLQPNKGFDNRLAMKAFVLSAYPIGKHHVKMVHYLNKFSFCRICCSSCTILVLGFQFLLQRAEVSNQDADGVSILSSFRESS